MRPELANDEKKYGATKREPMAQPQAKGIRSWSVAYIGTKIANKAFRWMDSMVLCVSAVCNSLGMSFKIDPAARAEVIGHCDGAVMVQGDATPEVPITITNVTL